MVNCYCGTKATFGYAGGKAINCKEHKKDDMIDVVSKMCNICHKTCAAFGWEEDNTKTRCAEHKTVPSSFLISNAVLASSEPSWKQVLPLALVLSMTVSPHA